MDGLKRYVNDDRFRVDSDKNMRLLAFAFTIVFVWTGPNISVCNQLVMSEKGSENFEDLEKTQVKIFPHFTIIPFDYLF